MYTPIRYLRQLLTYIVRHTLKNRPGHVVLMLLLCSAILSAKVNLSTNGVTSSLRGDIQIGRALEEFFGTDSLVAMIEMLDSTKNYYSTKNYFCGTLTYDSLGQVDSVRDLRSYKSINGERLPKKYTYTDDEKDRLAKILQKNKAVFSVYNLGWLCHRDSNCDSVVIGIYETVDTLATTRWAHTFVFPISLYAANEVYKNNWLALVNDVKHYISEYSDDYYYLFRDTTISDEETQQFINEANAEINNNAKFLLSLFYVIGDYHLNKWLDGADFKIAAKIDENGKITDLEPYGGVIPIDEKRLSLLRDFMISNNITLQSDTISSDNVILSFPSSLYTEYIQSNKFLYRIKLFEKRVREVVSKSYKNNM